MILDRDFDALQREGTPLLASLRDRLALRISGALDREGCARTVEGVYRGRAEWIGDFDAVQFSLGRAWYTHLEQEKARAYFANAKEADASVERFVPGLQARLRTIASSIVGANVTQRPGFCGAGVHVFPADGQLAHHGGDIHFDTEGLTRAQLRENARALSLVLMLQRPESGGATRLWNVLYEGSDEVTDTMRASNFVDVDYQPGNLVVFDSHRLHQIQPFAGARDRISATLHVAHAFGAWESWF